MVTQSRAQNARGLHRSLLLLLLLLLLHLLCFTGGGATARASSSHTTVCSAVVADLRSDCVIPDTLIVFVRSGRYWGAHSAVFQTRGADSQ